MDTNTIPTLDQYAKDTYLASIHKQGLKQPVGTPTDEDLAKMYNRFESMVNKNYKVYEDYLESLIDSFDDIELEIHKTTTLVNKATGEVISDNFHKIDKTYIEQKKKEFENFRYYRDKIAKNRPKGGVKVSGYKAQHRFTKVFTTARPQFKSHKNLGIFYDIARELSPFENIVSRMRNDNSFTPMTTKEIQEKFDISPHDMKQFKTEAKKLKLITDVKLGGKSVGIRVNPAYAINGQSFSNDVVEAFKDSPEFIQNVPENC